MITRSLGFSLVVLSATAYGAWCWSYNKVNMEYDWSCSTATGGGATEIYAVPANWDACGGIQTLGCNQCTEKTESQTVYKRLWTGGDRDCNSGTPGAVVPFSTTTINVFDKWVKC